MLDEARLAQLKQVANDVRKWTIEMLTSLGGGHMGGSLSIVDIVTALYFHTMRVDPKNPRWQERDRLILSKGHAGPGLYACLARKGYFEKELLHTLNRMHTNLPSHADMQRTPGIDQSTGSLGLGVSCAVGHAIAGKIKKQEHTVFAIVGDGELNEGTVWEAFMLAGARALDNFVVIIDANGLQIDGRTQDVLDTSPLDAKMRAFRFECCEVDGHDMAALCDALDAAKEADKPVCIIAKTVKAKGYKPLEGQATSHNLSAITKEQYEESVAYIDSTC